MTIPEDMMAFIEETARKAAREGAKEVVAEQARKAAGRCDRRLRNTKLLLKNYRMFKKHCTGAVYTDEAGEHDGQEEETALELLDMMLQRNNAITVESIRNSCRRTKIMIRHIDAMLGLYETYCAQSDNEALKRGLRIIKAMYIDETAKPVEQIAMQENVSARQVYRDHDAAVDKISMLMFGINDISTGYVSVHQYAGIPNVAGSTAYTSNWVAELFGPSNLKKSTSGFPQRLYNSVLQGALGIDKDGIFGANTEKTVKEFQSAHGLTADGIAGAKTKAALAKQL